jgi:hypothetical protein
MNSSLELRRQPFILSFKGISTATPKNPEALIPSFFLNPLCTGRNACATELSSPINPAVFDRFVVCFDQMVDFF